MILVIVFVVSGVIGLLVGFTILVEGGVNGAAFVAAAPALFSSLISFGFAQVIFALVRTAASSEAAVEELKNIGRRIDAREAGDIDRHEDTKKIAAAFDRLGRKQP